MIRAVTLPVAVPIGRTWDELNAALKPAFTLSTRAANWCVQQLYRRDTIGQAKTPDAVKQGRKGSSGFYAYGEASKEGWFKEWAPAKGSLQACLRAAHNKYLLHRFDVCVRHQQGLLTYKYPFPFPIPADSWTPGYTTEEGTPSGSTFPTVTITLPGAGRFVLRLRRGKEFGRQLAMFKVLHDTPDIRSEAAIYKDKDGNLLLKLVGDFPAPDRSKAPTAQHACLLRTDPAAFLVAEIDGRRPWILNCDHIRRRQAAHRAYLQRVKEDAKREKRLDPEQHRDLNKSRGLRCTKHNNVLKTFVHQTTSQVVKFIRRQRVGVVIFDDADRTYFKKGFPWYDVGVKLRYKLDELGVPLVSRSTLAPEEMTAWLEDRTLAEATALAGTRLVAGVRRRGPHPAVTPAPTTETLSPSKKKSSERASK